jgi:hypothetical protein
MRPARPTFIPARIVAVPEWPAQVLAWAAFPSLREDEGKQAEAARENWVLYDEPTNRFGFEATVFAMSSLR